jgi:hypothetical protein
MNGAVGFQHGATVGAPPFVRADAQGQHMDASAAQRTRIMTRLMICGHRWTSHKAKAVIGSAQAELSGCGRQVQFTIRAALAPSSYWVIL